MTMASKDVRRRLAALEQATVPPDERPTILIQPIDMATGQPVGAGVLVQMGARRPSEPLDYREAVRALCPPGYEHARWEQQADGTYVWKER